MRILGYTSPVSVESFRIPNIELVCEIIFWLVRRYEPSAELAFKIETDDERIEFFRRVCDIVLNKSRVRLNPKKLYQADGYAVQEMAKVANILKQAVSMRQEDPEADYSHLQAQVAQRNMQDAKRARTLCAELTSDGSNLYFMLEDERGNRPQRERVLSRATEVSEFERRLREQLQFVAQQVEATQDSLTNLASDESNLEQKIEANKTQLDRRQKSLNALSSVKPAFMEEYAGYEKQLKDLFVNYLEHYRNLEYLEHVLANLNKVEDELLAEQEAKLKAMRERLRQEEISALRGGADFVEGMLADGDPDSPNGGMMTADQAAARAAQLNAQRTDFSRGDLKRPRAASGRQRPPDAAAVAQAGASVAGGASAGGGGGAAASAQQYGSLGGASGGGGGRSGGGAGGTTGKIHLDEEDSELIGDDDSTSGDDDDDDDDSSDDSDDDDDSDDGSEDSRQVVGGRGGYDDDN